MESPLFFAAEEVFIFVGEDIILPKYRPLF